MDYTAKKRAGLIGLGIITKRYVVGLAESPFLRLCATVDLNEEAVGRASFPDVPFYTDYRTMIAEQKPDCVIISVPPSQHFAIAAYCLEHGVHVIIEKPVTLCLSELDALQALAKKNSLQFHTLFHWHGGIETQAFTREYPISRIEKIQVKVEDPYCSDGETINSDRRPLMGAWIDSGVNVLSMLHLWLPFESLEILCTETVRCKETNMPIYVNVSLQIDDIPVEISVDWRNGVERKESFVTMEGRYIHIRHSEQSIADGEVTELARMPRLDEHYRSLFRGLTDASNFEFSYAVHQFLFEVNEVL